MAKGIRTTNFDAILASAPLNKGAAVVANGKGEHFVPRKQIFHDCDFRSDVPPKMKPFPAKGIPEHNITGLKVGRLTVIGLADFPNRKKAAAWVVRCVCGYYETRVAKTLKNPEYAKRAACGECDYLNELRAGRTTGEFPKQTVHLKPKRRKSEIAGAGR